MNIYLVKRIDDVDYDQYKSFVCIAPDVETARKIDPSSCRNPVLFSTTTDEYDFECWVPYNELKFLKVKHIGVSDSDKLEIVCASYNAG